MATKRAYSLTITKIVSFTFGNSKLGCTFASSHNTSYFFLLLFSFYLKIEFDYFLNSTNSIE
ncbi:hypothetical protein SAMN02927916_0444 [Flavobacterium anhuiense]|uniref:Uncharacterized protein n=1 Tax=Flavobacterium anhuiense TaxID=459526 RepID=A0ABY0L6H9_9FLAO|nr:hypothetical protein SAMN02927916_0444 [Flavobacterium anhuiense]